MMFKDDELEEVQEELVVTSFNHIWFFVGM